MTTTASTSRTITFPSSRTSATPSREGFNKSRRSCSASALRAKSSCARHPRIAQRQKPTNLIERSSALLHVLPRLRLACPRDHPLSPWGSRCRKGRCKRGGLPRRTATGGGATAVAEARLQKPGTMESIQLTFVVPTMVVDALPRRASSTRRERV